MFYSPNLQGMKFFYIIPLLVLSLILGSSFNSKSQNPVYCHAESCQFTGFGDQMRFLWIPGLPGPGNIKYNSTESSLTFDYLEDGKAHIFGEVYNQTHPEYGFFIDVYFTDRMTWDEWMPLGRGWKGDEADVGDNYEDWTYYILDENEDNKLVGIGEYEGSLIQLTHKPANYFYGLQVGLGANDQNAEEGLSCWMYYEGTCLGEEVDGNCDINGEGQCTQELVLECALDIQVSCEQGYSPEITGTPVVECAGYTLDYTDELSGNCPITVTRTWEASHPNYPSVTCIQEITVEDNVAPVFIDPPEDITVSCGEIPEASIEVEEECALQFADITTEDNQLSGACFPVVQRTFIAEDECGNISTHIQYITVIDDQAPEVLNSPEDINLLCGDDIPEYIPEVEDNCSVSHSLVYAESETYNSCGYEIEQVWTVTDGCNNSTVVSRVVTFEDNSAPYLLEPLPEITLECGSEMPTPEFIDECSLDLEVEVNFPNLSGCEESFEATYLVTDNCGNSAEFSQSVTIIDTSAPVFSAIEAEIFVACNELENVPAPQVTDCNTFNLTFQDLEVDSEGCKRLLRTWLAEDLCGNLTSISQYINLTDDEAPVFLDTPTDQFYTCGTLPDAEIPEATDNCDSELEITISEVSNPLSCGLLITRTYTATDNCGNTSSISHDISINDEEPPMISGLTEITVECGTALEDLVAVTDDCLNYVELTFTDEVISLNQCEEVVQRDYLATDPCGNQATFSQLITFIDSTPPEIAEVPDLNFQCFANLAEVPSPLVTDNCSNADLTFTDTAEILDCGQRTYRTWTATDACGNQSQYVQHLTISDTEAPVFTSTPESLTLECGAEIPPVTDVSAVDNCSEVQVQLTQTEAEGACESSFSIFRTWIAIDACGNSAEHTQLIEVVDSTPPVFEIIPEDFTASCGDNLPVAAVSAVDNCSDVSVEFEQQVSPGGCPNIYRIWTATDACGNSSTAIQSIFIEDNEPPVISGIEFSLDATCENIPDIPIPDVTDNCDENVSVTVSESVNGSGCEQTLVRVWIATDDCGNTTIATQSINLIDEAPPVFINPISDNAVECRQLNSLPFPEVQDNCGGDIDITYTDEELSTGCEAQILRTYTASDLCGNSATLEQLITVIDLSPPSFSGVLAGTFVDCGSIPPAISPVVYDECNNEDLEILFTEQQLGSGCSYTLLRTWQATDVCGNSATASRYIFVQDNEGPSLSDYPENVYLNCGAILPPVPEITATDNCSELVEVNFSESTEDSACGTVTNRTWSSEDECGNVTEYTQILEISDFDAPEIIDMPEDLSVTCAQIPEPGPISALDNCDINPEITFSEEWVAGGCPYYILRTWTATDACGNSTSRVQTISVTDDEAPVFDQNLENFTVSCANLSPAPELSATDNCGVEQVELTETFNGEGCDIFLNRTWVATDFCGNSTSLEQIITLIDESQPEVGAYEAELSFQCSDELLLPSLEFTDDCSELDVQYSESRVESSCSESYDLERSWIATDACGNSKTALQIVHVIDSRVPELSLVDEEITVTCNEIPDVPTLAVFGECGNYEVNYDESVEYLETLESTCDLGNAVNSSSETAIWLPTLSNSGADFTFGPEGGQINEDETTGNITITGQVFNTVNPNESWVLSLILYDEQNWDEWSANGGSYKDDLGVNELNHIEWSYYKLSSESSLIGALEYEGSELSLIHTPVDYTYGFQVGVGANNRNMDYGISGWFFYEGMLDGEFVMGNGDLIAEINCCPDQDITRIWTVTDCSGNMSQVTQIIHVRKDLELSDPQLMESTLSDFDVRNSMGSEFVITFNSGNDAQKTLLMTDLAGKIVYQKEYKDLEKNTVYTRRVSKNEFIDGMYMFYLKGRTAEKSDKEIKLD